MHENLSQFAHEMGVSFELEVVNFDSFDPRSFPVSGNEAIVVNLPIWTDLPFPHYLLQGLQYYEVLLDSIDGGNVVSEISNKIERFLFQPQIESLVLGKLQVPEPMPHWRSLFTAGGYSPVFLSNFAETQADCVVKRMQVQGFHIEKKQLGPCSLKITGAVLFSRSDSIEEADSGFVGNKNKRSRADLLTSDDEFSLSYSSIMFSRSSSVVTEINESRSSDGS
ncbi:hypothetical protein LXL04_030738 [Taraxacum kok-saghyz]